MIQLAKLATQIDPKNIKQATIDENMVVAYNTPTESAAERAGAHSRQDPRTARSVLQQRAAASSIGAAPAPTAGSARIRVENGTQINGLAARTSDRLTAQGFNVVEIDSADRFDYAQSQIISYTADTTVAAAVARTLGLPASAIVTSTANSTDRSESHSGRGLSGSRCHADALGR